MEISSESESPGGGPTIVTVRAKYEDQPDITATHYEGAQRFRLGFYWDTKDLDRSTVEYILDNDEDIEEDSMPDFISTTGINEVSRNEENFGIDYNEDSYGVLSNGMPSDTIVDHYAATTGINDLEKVEKGLEGIQEELVEQT